MFICTCAYLKKMTTLRACRIEIFRRVYLVVAVVCYFFFLAKIPKPHFWSSFHKKDFDYFFFPSLVILKILIF